MPCHLASRSRTPPEYQAYKRTVGKVTSEQQRQLDAFTTPGSLLRGCTGSGRAMSAREAADRLNLMPDYVEYSGAG